MKILTLLLTSLFIIGCGTQNADDGVEGYSTLVGTWSNKCENEEDRSIEVILQFNSDHSFWTDTRTFSDQDCTGHFVGSSTTGGWHIDDIIVNNDELTFMYSIETPRNAHGTRYPSPMYTFTDDLKSFSAVVHYKTREFEKI